MLLLENLRMHTHVHKKVWKCWLSMQRPKFTNVATLHYTCFINNQISLNSFFLKAWLHYIHNWIIKWYCLSNNVVILNTGKAVIWHNVITVMLIFNITALLVTECNIYNFWKYSTQFNFICTALLTKYIVSKQLYWNIKIQIFF